MAVDRGGRRENRVPEEKGSEQRQIEIALFQVIPEHVSRDVVIKALVNVLDQVVQDAFSVEKGAKRE